VANPQDAISRRGWAGATFDLTKQHEASRSSEDVDQRLHGIMRSVHQECWDTAERFGTPGN